MRNQLFATSLLAVAALVGCGGDDGKIKVPDAKVFKDAGIDAPHVCQTKDSYGQLSLGSATTPAAAGNWIIKTMNGTVEFGVYFAMSPMTDPAVDRMYLIVPEPSTGFLANVPYKFDLDPNTSAPAALAILDGDTDSMGNTTQELWPVAATPDSSITFMDIGKTAGAKISFKVNMTTFKEIDDNGAVIAGGCQSTLTSLTVYSTQKDAVARVASPSDQTGSTPNGTARTISDKEMLSQLPGIQLD